MFLVGGAVFQNTIFLYFVFVQWAFSPPSFFFSPSLSLLFQFYFSYKVMALPKRILKVSVSFTVLAWEGCKRS